MPCNRRDRLRTCWCVKAFRCNIARPAHFHSEGGRLRRRGRSELGWGVFPHSLAAPELAEVVGTDIRCAPRRPAVVAVGETRQPDRRPHHRRGPDRPLRSLAVPLHQRTWLTASYIGHLDAMATCTDRSRQRPHHHRQLQRLPARGRRGPQFREVAVIGIADCEWGESVCAVIVPASILRAGRLGYERELARQG